MDNVATVRRWCDWVQEPLDGGGVSMAAEGEGEAGAGSELIGVIDLIGEQSDWVWISFCPSPVVARSQ